MDVNGEIFPVTILFIGTVVPVGFVGRPELLLVRCGVFRGIFLGML